MAVGLSAHFLRGASAGLRSGSDLDGGRLFRDPRSALSPQARRDRRGSRLLRPSPLRRPGPGPSTATGTERLAGREFLLEVPQPLLHLFELLVKPVEVLRAVPENAAITEHHGTVAEGPGVAVDLAPDIASEIAAEVTSDIVTEVSTEMSSEVAQVKLVVVARPSFDFDSHLGRRAIARDLELQRIARLRVPHGAGQIGRVLDMLAAGPRDDVSGAKARLFRRAA